MRLIPAYPPCPDCHNKGIFEIARSRNDMLKLAFYISMQLSLLSPLSDLSPSSDAVDDQFQHTLDVLTGIMMGQSNLQAPELLIGMLNYV